jgi:hypothetical protein
MVELPNSALHAHSAIRQRLPVPGSCGCCVSVAEVVVQNLAAPVATCVSSSELSVRMDSLLMDNVRRAGLLIELGLGICRVVLRMMVPGWALDCRAIARCFAEDSTDPAAPIRPGCVGLERTLVRQLRSGEERQVLELVET